MVDAEHRQGTVYKIKCADCNQYYIGEKKHWFVTRKKEHICVTSDLWQGTQQLYQDTPYDRNMKLSGKILNFLTLKVITLNENLLNHFLLIRKIIV